MINNDNTDIFLNQLTQFYSNNATNFHHLTSHSTPCCPITWRSYSDYCDVTSPYLYYYEHPR